MKTKLLIIISLHIILLNVISAKDTLSKSFPSALTFENIKIDGELRTRILKNFDRLEETKYQPEHVFLTDEESEGWPGDTEGRTILALVMDAQATGRTPKYLEKIIQQLPLHLNSKGYLGKIYPKGVLDEQQLSGNCWTIWGLCEYYKWKKDYKVLGIVKSIVDSLFIPGKGLYKNYSVDPEIRKADKNLIGRINKIPINGWILSSDIGAMPSCIDGLATAYEFYRNDNLKEIITEMIDFYLKVDHVSLKEHLHGTLTSLRGILKFAQLTYNIPLIKVVENKFQLYKQYGMAEDYSNYNWYNRYDTWSEPCAVVDSYMLASQLWMFTQNPQYLADRDLIYYNGLCHEQRANGGFGCDANTSSKKNLTNVTTYEAHWCCTMHGGNGLTRVVEYSHFRQADTLSVLHYTNNKLTVSLGKNNSISLQQISKYPFEGNVLFKINQVSRSNHIVLKLNSLPTWAKNPRITLNGKIIKVKSKNGFYIIQNKWKQDDEIAFNFEQEIHVETPLNLTNCSNEQHKIFYGPLLLGSDEGTNISFKDVENVIRISPMQFKDNKSNIELKPYYHLLNSSVKDPDYKFQYLFSNNANKE